VDQIVQIKSDFCAADNEVTDCKKERLFIWRERKRVKEREREREKEVFEK
jgi:hypothetical protein